MVQGGSQGALKTGAAMAAVCRLSRLRRARHDTCSTHTTATHTETRHAHAACGPRGHVSQEGLCMPAGAAGTTQAADSRTKSEPDTQKRIHHHTQLAAPGTNTWQGAIGRQHTGNGWGTGRPSPQQPQIFEPHAAAGACRRPLQHPSTRVTRNTTPPCAGRVHSTGERHEGRRLP